MLAFSAKMKVMSESSVEVSLDQKIEGVLFYKATPMKKAALQKLFLCSDSELQEALHTLKERLKGSGIQLVDINTDVELVTIPELDQFIESLRKDDMRREIGKAGAETLAIVLYRGPLSRADIDRIRGVNSSFILRNLAVRGLVEKDTTNKQVQYKATTELLNHLGVAEKSEMPEFTEVMNALDVYEREQATETT